MATLSALATLIELAQRDCDECARKLGAALQALDEAGQKLDMLLGYREDYARKLEAAQAQGITPQAYHNFIAFVGKLDSAIVGQREVLRHAEHRSTTARQAWQESERKRLSYRTLNERAAAEALKRENRRDQKAMDEHAARSAHYKR